MSWGQSIRYKNYTLRATDPSHAKALSISKNFLRSADVGHFAHKQMEFTAEVTGIHGEQRSVWRIRFGNDIQMKVDMQTQQVVSMHDLAREYLQFKGLQPKRKLLIRTREEARRRVEATARKLGIPGSCKPDSFVFKQNPGDLPKSAGRAGMTFKNPAGERIAGLSIDLLDGGINGFWIVSWKVKKDAPRATTR